MVPDNEFRNYIKAPTKQNIGISASFVYLQNETVWLNKMNWLWTAEHRSCLIAMLFQSC